jgi:hypothetical protein
MIQYTIQFQIHNNQIQIPKVEGKHIFPLYQSLVSMKKLIETNLKLGKKLKDKKHKDRQMIVAQYLNDLIFHRLKKTKKMYKQVLDIDFKNTDWLDTAIKVRHHCVHRALCFLSFNFLPSFKLVSINFFISSSEFVIL